MSRTELINLCNKSFMAEGRRDELIRVEEAFQSGSREEQFKTDKKEWMRLGSSDVISLDMLGSQRDQRQGAESNSEE